RLVWCAALGTERLPHVGVSRSWRSGRLDPRLTQRPVDLGQRVAEQVLHVGDPELEERGALNDALGARRILLAGELDDQPAAPDDLHDGLGGAELFAAA